MMLNLPALSAAERDSVSVQTSHYSLDSANRVQRHPNPSHPLLSTHTPSAPDPHTLCSRPVTPSAPDPHTLCSRPVTPSAPDPSHSLLATHTPFAPHPAHPRPDQRGGIVNNRK